MTPLTETRRLTAIALLMLLLLSGCAAPPQRQASMADLELLYEQRHQRLAQAVNWELKARLAVSSGDEGGSGHFTWQLAGNYSEMDFYGALGRGAWRLIADDGMAELTLASGELYRAGSVEELVRNQVGWDIPVDDLAWWVRGLVAPGPFSSRNLDQQGQLSSLTQSGWAIRFERYAPHNGVSLPMRLTASRGDSRVRLAVRDWRLVVPAPGVADANG